MSLVLFLQDLALPREACTRLLREAGVPHKPVWTGDQAFDPKGVEILVTSHHHVDGALLARYPNLQMISCAFTGHDEVELEACGQRGVEVYYVPDYSTASVAELAVGLAIAVLRKVPQADRSARAGRWDEQGSLAGNELRGRTVGIVGTGTIGQHAARLFAAFGCPLVGYSRTTREAFRALGGEYCDDLGGLLERADVVSLHVPDGLATRGLMGAGELKALGPEGILVNTSRGALVDPTALVAALEQRTIRGAGLDVFAEEPIPEGHPLARLDNVVLTPHLGFKTEEALRRLARAALLNVGRFLHRDGKNRLLANPRRDR
jgi:D-3-phosphoglycerate dehydrogenase